MLADQTKMIRVKGTACERGEMQGEVFRDKKRHIIDGIRNLEELVLFNLHKKIPIAFYEYFFKKQGRLFLRYHREVLAAGEGERLEHVRGLASGLGVDADLVYGLSALEVLTSELPHLPSYACSSLIFKADQTKVNRPLIAYNHDFPDSFGPHIFVRHNSPKNRYKSVSLAYPVLLGAIAGVNEKGLAVTINHAFERGVKKTQAALFVTWLLQECLDTCATADDAARLVLKTRVTNGSMLNFADANGGRAVVEVCSHGNVRRPMDKGISFTFNKYRIKKMEEHELPMKTVGTKMFRGRLVHQANIDRQCRFDALFKSDHAYSEKEIHQLMSDHGADEQPGMGSICRHDKSTSSTLASAILDPAQGTMKVIFGRACAGKYQTYAV